MGRQIESDNGDTGQWHQEVIGKWKQPGQMGRREDMDYHCQAASSAGFVQQLASCYLPHGYWFYVTGRIPDRKDPRRVDAKLLDKYHIAVSRSSRSRRKQAGLANVHYLRYRRFFVLLATHGRHPFYDHETGNIRDARRIPIRFENYSITVKPGGYLRKTSPGTAPIRDNKYRVRVQIAKDPYRDLKAYFLDIATHRTVEQLGKAFYCLPYEPYAPVRQQLLEILRVVNKARKAARLEPVSPTVLRYRRQIVRPFGEGEG